MTIYVGFFELKKTISDSIFNKNLRGPYLIWRLWKPIGLRYFEHGVSRMRFFEIFVEYSVPRARFFDDF